ncbi:MAG: hypothetical protein CL878_02685, partial [Dehalococcoidia bacterium]|nr:hypothetical protein [Dehalococcoidia bacterium]
WPLLYLLGGGDHLLPLSIKEWDAITQQFAGYGQIHKEFERGYDWFHQGESYIYFYYLSLADPARRKQVERAQRFAGLYLNEDPEAPNYDPEHKLIRAPHNGSGGPRWGFSDEDPPSYSWSPGMRRYGLPFHDVPGIGHYDDLKDPALALRLGQAMHERLGRGDVPANLAATSLVTNAYLHTGDDKYKRWVLDYVEAWIDRARQNGGLLPDNIGLTGQIGEYNSGRWWGGLYGWTWPHGFYNIGMAAIIAAANAMLLTGDTRYLDLPRTQIDRIIELGVTDDGTLKVPYRYGDQGWFEYRQLDLLYPVAVWIMSMDPADLARIERLRAASTTDWRAVHSFRNKHDDGHEAPWLRFLAGDNPEYPEAILRESLGQVYQRMKLISEDQEDLSQVHVHHWQQLNPVLTEGLVQLTLGAPQVVYNGGLLMAPLRYFDAHGQRAGLPPDVAALVEKLAADRAVVHLVNLSPVHDREVVIQAGAFGEHRLTTARVIGPDEPEPDSFIRVNGKHLTVQLPPGTELRLDLGMERFVHHSSLTLPWHRSNSRSSQAATG